MNLLFLCVANSARSQIAEGLARVEFPTAEVKSAGSVPSVIHPHAVEVLKEIEIETSSQYSKSIDQLGTEFLNNLDFVITHCEEEVCPALVLRNKKVKRLHWPLPDPAKRTKEPTILEQKESLERFRVTREKLRVLLRNWKASVDAKENLQS